VNGEWKPLAAACLLILCVGLAYGFAFSPSDPFLPYKFAFQDEAPTCDEDLYKALTDLGSFIGGVLALFAGGIAYFGVRQATNRQLRANEKRDLLQAQTIAFAITPELVYVQGDLEHALVVFREDFPKLRTSHPNRAIAFTQLASHLAMSKPAALDRNYDNLYLLGDAGRKLSLLASTIVKYNDSINSITMDIRAGVNSSFDPTEIAESLSGHVHLMQGLLRDVQPKVAVICNRGIIPDGDSTVIG
jgi:hypothetical protein